MEASGGAETSGVVQQQQPLLGKEKSKTMKVMVALDESDSSFYALKWALDHLFKQPTGAAPMEEEIIMNYMVTLVHVQAPFQPFIYPAGPVVYATPTVVEAVSKAQDENAAALLSRALHMCKEKMAKAETLILNGDPKDSICQAAEEMQVDLLVVGSRGLGAIKRAFLGSVSDYCAHHAHCPILIVKPPKQTK